MVAIDRIKKYRTIVCRLAAVGILSVVAVSANALTVSIESLTSETCDGSFTVDVSFSDLAENQSLTSFGMRVLYENPLFDFVSIQRANAVSDWALVDANETTPGTVIIGGAAFAGSPITEEGVIFSLTFTRSCSTSPCASTLTLANLSANTTGADTVNGLISCGASEGEGSAEGEGAPEGSTEGVIEGEGATEGVVEGSTEGTAEGSVEGSIEGEPEGSAEGEGVTEGEPEVFSVVVESITEDACSGSIVVDVSLAGVGERTISSFGVDIGFDTSVLTFVNDTRGPALDTWGLVDANVISEGVVRVGGAALAGTPLTDSAVLFSLEFTRTCTTSPCSATLEVVSLSANTSTALGVDGVVTCAGGGEGEGEGVSEGEGEGQPSEGEGEGTEEDLPPTAVCQDVTVDLRADGFAFVTAAQVDGGSTDDVGVASLSLSRTGFNCSNVGANTVTLTVTDSTGQTDTCDATVTVRDTGVDNVACKNFATILDENGTVTIEVTDIDNGSRDACGIESRVLSKTDFTCEDVGQNTVTLTVTDRNGNVGTCDATVTIADVLFACEVPDTFSLSVDVEGNGSVNIVTAPNAPDGLTYTSGTPVEIEATANEGAVFSEWQGDIDDATIDGATIEVVMNMDREITAVFEEAAPPFGCNAFNGGGPLSCRCNAFGPSPSIEELLGQLFLGALTVMTLLLMAAYQKRFW